MLRCTYLHDGVLTLYQNKILLYSGLDTLSPIPFCDMVTSYGQSPYNWEGRVTVDTVHVSLTLSTVLPGKSDSDLMFCLQIYQGLIIDRSLVY